MVLAALALAAPAIAAVRDGLAEADAQRRVAFVVGNSDYRNIAPLPNPRRDAEAVADALERIGFLVTRVMDGDRQTLVTALAEFAERSRGSDIVLFYYAGHGVQINGENYLLPVSIEATSADAVLEQSLSLDAVRGRFRTADPGLSIFVLDSCRDNPFGPLATRKTSETATPLIIGRGLAQAKGAAGMLIAYATQPGELALDGDGEHSPFTASLLQYLEHPGLEIRLMLGRVREDVVAKTRGAQVPWVEEAVLGEFYFSERVETAAGGGLASDDVVFWRSIWRSTEAQDYEAYLNRFPDGAFAVLAANRLKALSRRADKSAPGPLVLASLEAEEWREIKNSLYWLGYYNGPLTGAADAAVGGSIQAFQSGRHESPTGALTRSQMAQLHDGAAGSLVTLGERLAERIVFDRARLVSIKRGVAEIALPAYRELARRLAGRADGEAVLAEAKQQLETMQQQRDMVAEKFDRVWQNYLTVVAAAGSGYAEQVRTTRFSGMRAGDTTTVSDRYLPSRRRQFMEHALDYAKRGRFNEELWLQQLR